MLMVAPSGSTNDVTSRETPSFSCTFFMLTGSVPADEHVVNAIIMASLMPWKNFIGEWPPQTRASVE